MDVVREFRTAAVRLHVLHHAAEGDVHGAWMLRELRHHSHQIGPGTLYPLLHRMEQAGLLTSEHEVVGGHRRRPYRATPHGRAALAACRQALAELADEVLTGAAAATGQQSFPRDLPEQGP
jgi:DNA-binding PadR family transcriptional regulator